ncbi:MAG TPA: 8-amino-7-oxononanoate synthase [Burkholderiales bacterium]|jgi:8-amino-7-oxononanoate synthase|nr:8-amino-7-oxononanoate synthase [Burkholderiales bacterium]
MPDLSPRLDELARAGLARRRRTVESADGPHLLVDGHRYLAFCSNDYLGLAHHPALIEAACRGAERYGVGAGASALISGHTEAHEALEARLARFVRLPRALHFGAGYLANLGLVAALAGRGGTVFSDELNHACLVDGARLSRAEVQVYPHLDVAALGRLLESCTTAEKLVATDAVFSMDGDLAPLPELLELCERHDAWLVVDDAHGFGVLGERGRGALSQFGIASPRIAYMGTLGKAAGVHGAFVAGDEALIEWLVQRARTYVFTTASPPLLACALMASLELIEQEESRRNHLRALVGRLRQRLEDLPWRLRASDTPIQPLIVGDNRAALDLAEGLRSRGIWVPAIRPPTVPAGTARLRIALSAAHSVEHVDELAAALHELAKSR